MLQMTSSLSTQGAPFAVRALRRAEVQRPPIGRWCRRVSGPSPPRSRRARRLVGAREGEAVGKPEEHVENHLKSIRNHRNLPI